MISKGRRESRCCSQGEFNDFDGTVVMEIPVMEKKTRTEAIVTFRETTHIAFGLLITCPLDARIHSAMQIAAFVPEAL